MLRIHPTWLAVLVASFTCTANRPLPTGDGAQPGKLPDVPEFNRDVRPILSDNCYACHGPDKNKRKAGLRLDTEAGLLAGGPDAAIAPGKPEESELVRRITSTNPEQHMPPAETAKSLSDRDVQIIRRWIEQGAKWEGHWSFMPLKKPDPPGVDDSKFVRNPIDSFVLQAMRQHGLEPSPEADRNTLARRLSLDLNGLPPDWELVARFAADTSPQSYERLVDQLIQSPHFGERMAMWWLDLVRYADSVGYHGDQPVSVFPFRQYVIDSFNSNKRFDQFTLEQLAGDLLPEPTIEQKIASGYNRLGMMSAEGGVQDKEYLAKYIAERVRNASGTWLGVTVGCAECHDHKYDPFTTRDFYRFEAFFADIQEKGLYGGANATGEWGPRIKLPKPAEAEELAALDRQIAETKKVLETATPELAAAQSAWEKGQVRWVPLKPTSVTSAGGATLRVLDDSSVLAGGNRPANDTYILTLPDPPAGITALRIDVLPDDSLPKKGPGRADNGNFVLTELQARLQAAGGEAPEQPLALQNATATHEQTSSAEKTPDKKWSAGAAIDGDAKGPGFGWAILDQVGKPNHAVFETAAGTTGGGPGTILIVTLAQNHENPGHLLGRFRLSATTSPRPVRAGGDLPANITALLDVPEDKRTDAQKTELATYYRSIAPALDATRSNLKRLEQSRKDLDNRISTTLVTVAVAPRVIRILPRGNWMDERGEIVTPAVPAFLPQLHTQDQRATRLDLARWLVAPDNPLTARAFVNRVWKLFFGAGLSRKLDDLGAQGEWPSHPLLLDWLATRFVESGWDVKSLVRLIVTSGTYRQSSQGTSQSRETDPYNRWLSRQGRFRLDAEMVRDGAMAVSGLLVDEIGGPSVRPYQPPGYWAYLNFPTREWENGKGDELYRRGLYTHWQRQYLHPALLAFDAPSREECTADRARSNTPLQSLVLLNDPSYVEAARAFAELMIRSGGSTPPERLDWAFRRTVARPIRPAEAQILLGLLERHRTEYSQDQAAAAELLAVGAKPAPADIDKVELAAWTSVARTILNLHEVITRN